MEFIVAFAVLASALWIMCVKLPPRQLVTWLVTLWGAAILAPMAVALVRSDLAAIEAAGVVVAVYGLPAIALVGGIWLATGPHHVTQQGRSVGERGRGTTQ